MNEQRWQYTEKNCVSIRQLHITFKYVFLRHLHHDLNAKYLPACRWFDYADVVLDGELSYDTSIKI